MAIDIFCSPKAIEESIYQTPNFYVRVGKGLIAPGHIMIIPKEHYDCIALQPRHLDDELGDIKEKVQEKIKKEIGEAPIFIEYGLWGQTVPHAHIQVVPSKSSTYEISSLIEEMVVPEDRIKYEKTNMTGLKEVLDNEEGYVSIEEKGELWVLHVKGIDYNDPELRMHLRYRKFFEETKKLVGLGKWDDMSIEIQEADERVQVETRKLLSFQH